MLAPWLQRYEIPGMAVAMVENGELIATGVAGLRQRGRLERVAITDRFHLGSEAKPMTATLCAMLVEEGKLRWDSTLAEVFPDLSEGMLPVFREVTLRQLLTHRTGIAETIGPDDWKKLKAFEGTPTEARRAWFEYIVTREPETSPGSRFVYSNTNYVIAGYMIEHVTSQAYEEIMRDRLFIPLGMTSAGFGPPGQAEVYDQPRGHRESGDPLQPGPNADNPPMFAPSGTVHCSVLDWAKFASLHATRGESQRDLLSRASYIELQTPHYAGDDESNLRKVAPTSVGYAMGWFVLPGGVLAHTGTNTRWFANLAVVPKDRLAVLVACNQGGDQSEEGCHEALRALIRDYYRDHEKER